MERVVENALESASPEQPSTEYLKLLLGVLLVGLHFSCVAQQERTESVNESFEIEFYYYSNYLGFAQVTGLFSENINRLSRSGVGAEFAFNRLHISLSQIGLNSEFKRTVSSDTSWAAGNKFRSSYSGLHVGYDLLKNQKVRLVPSIFGGIKSFNGRDSNPPLITDTQNYPSFSCSLALGYLFALNKNQNKLGGHLNCTFSVNYHSSFIPDEIISRGNMFDLGLRLGYIIRLKKPS